MNIFVATTKTQGQSPNDFCLCNEGEIVHPAGASILRGLDTSKVTTTMMVIDTERPRDELVSLLCREMGYHLHEVSNWMDKASLYPVGTVLEYRDYGLAVREAVPRSEAEIEKLKAGWRRDPCYDIYDAVGFEYHREELLAYQNQVEEASRLKKEQELETRAGKLGCSVELVRVIQGLEFQLQELKEKSQA